MTTATTPTAAPERDARSRRPLVGHFLGRPVQRYVDALAPSGAAGRGRAPAAPVSYLAARGCTLQLRGGLRAELRPITPEDLPALAELFAGLTGRSRYLRFFQGMDEVPRATLEALSPPPGGRHDAWLAAIDGRCVAEARVVQSSADPSAGEIAFTVAEDMRRLGLATALVRLLAERARRRGIVRLTYDVLGENRAAAALLHSLGGSMRFEDGILTGAVSLPLRPAAEWAPAV